MVRNPDEDRKVIAGIARLGEVYMRISERIQSAYEDHPKLKFQASRLFELAGYTGMNFDITKFLERMEADAGLKELSPEEKKTLKVFAKKFNDPVLVEEVVWEYAVGNGRERSVLMARIKEQLAVFPDPSLGISDLFSYGYRQYDMFPVRAEIAAAILSLRTVKVYGLYEDGGKIRLTSQAQIREHSGMFGVKRSEWMNFRIDAFREGKTIEFDFTEPVKEYRIYQIREDLPGRRDLSFIPYDVLHSMGEKVRFENYSLIYEGTTAVETTLEDLFVMFNMNHPEGFRGHSLSVSDVVVVRETGEWTGYYVDSFGFRKLETFLPEDVPGIREELTDKEKETVEMPEEKEPEEVPKVKESDSPANHKDLTEKTDDLQTRVMTQKPKTR